MSSGLPAPSLLTYLTCELPQGYPFDPQLTPQSIPLLKERHRKMLAVQQAAFFEKAQSLSATHPWLAYLAALKHEAILSFVPVETTPFVSVTDQKYFNILQENWRSLRHEIRKAVDDGIAFFCERLVGLQREAALIDEVEKNLGVAVTKGFAALLPITLEPPADASPEALKQWTHQDAYLQLCERPLNRITSLPAEMRQNGLKKLPDCVAALRGLREERDILVATYIAPYVS